MLKKYDKYVGERNNLELIYIFFLFTKVLLCLLFFYKLNMMLLVINFLVNTTENILL